MLGLPSILSLLRKEFNKFNNTGARMLDYIDHMALNYLKIAFSGENVNIFPSFRQRWFKLDFFCIIYDKYTSNTEYD